MRGRPGKPRAGYRPAFAWGIENRRKRASRGLPCMFFPVFNVPRGSRRGAVFERPRSEIRQHSNGKLKTGKNMRAPAPSARFLRFSASCGMRDGLSVGFVRRANPALLDAETAPRRAVILHLPCSPASAWACGRIPPTETTEEPPGRYFHWPVFRARFFHHAGRAGMQGTTQSGTVCAVWRKPRP